MKRVMLLVDADNVSVDVIQQALDHVLAAHGAVHVRRAYCTPESAVKHQGIFKRLSIRPVVNLSAGKNSTDIAMAADAVDLAVCERPDVVVLVSSDSDFAPLVIKLREKGCRVEGIGQTGKTSDATIQVYDSFVDLTHRKRPGPGPAPGPRQRADEPGRGQGSRERQAGPAPRPVAQDETRRSGRRGDRRGQGGERSAAPVPAPAALAAPVPVPPPEPAAIVIEDTPPAFAPGPEPAPVETIEAAAPPPPRARATKTAGKTAGKTAAQASTRTPAPADPKEGDAPKPRRARAGARAAEVAEAAEAAVPQDEAAPPAGTAEVPPAAPARKAVRKTAARKTRAAAAEPAPPEAAADPVPPPAPVDPPEAAPSPAVAAVPEDVRRILEAVPELRGGGRVELGIAAERLRHEKLLSKNAPSTKLFKKHPQWFVLTPERQPNKVQWIGAAAD